ncbi:DUF6233 domain-containing protein [Streptomyces sp. NPDC096142]|uniref:DUF6233 domain-containing protein n=1 Tax=Streptomyces sp. NPDC096142 TaxID=3366077 RepID=UPI003830F1A6
MNELPPDPPRLRAILTHLEQQLTTTEAVGIYLRLQRTAVQQALAAAEHQGAPRPSAPVPPGRPQPPQRATRMKLRPGTYMLEPKIAPDHPRPALVHIGGCNRVDQMEKTSEITMREAELALTQDVVGAEACPHCRPEGSLDLGT